MNKHADKTQEKKSQSVSNGVSQKQSNRKSTFQFVDNRPEAVAQRKQQEMANNSPQAIQLYAFQDMANHNNKAQKVVTQRVLDEDQIGDAWEKVYKYAQNKGVNLTDEQEQAIENYFNARKTPGKANDAIGGARKLIDAWVPRQVEQEQGVEAPKRQGWQKGPKTGQTGRIKPDGEHHLSKGDKSLSKAERDRRRAREGRQFGEGGGGRFAE